MRNISSVPAMIVMGLATTAFGSELSIELASGDPLAASVAVGDTVTINVLWTQNADEAANAGLGFYGFTLTGAPQNYAGTTATPDRFENDALFVVSNTPANGFSDGGVVGTVGGLSNIAGGANTPATSLNDAVTDLVLGSFDIRADAEGVHEIYIFRNATLLSPDMAGANGGTLSFSNNPDSYNEFSIGSGFAGRNDGSDAIPLVLTVTASGTGGGSPGGGGAPGGGGTDDGSGTDDGTGTDDGSGTDDGTGADGGTGADDGGTGPGDGSGTDGGGDDGQSDGGTDGGTSAGDGDGSTDGDAGNDADGNDDDGSTNPSNPGNTGGGFCAVGMVSTTMAILSGLAMMWGVTRKQGWRRRI